VQGTLTSKCDERARTCACENMFSADGRVVEKKVARPRAMLHAGLTVHS
jgi:hypothetical protein